MNRRETADQLTELIAKALLTYEKSLNGVEVPMTAEELNNEWVEKYTGRNFSKQIELRYNTFKAITDSVVGTIMRDLTI